jgi:LmbE family N-acetylglucosaminyl deacetylase
LHYEQRRVENISFREKNFMTVKQKILIISPHPDDEAIGCGGLISRTTDCQDVHVLFCGVGKCRQIVTGHTDENTRLVEAENSSKMGNFTYEFIFIGDQFMRLDSVPQKDLIDPIENCIAARKPDVVCIPSQFSYDQDHRAVFTAAYTALRPIPQSIRHFCKVVLEYEEPYTWSLGEGFKPNYYIQMSTSQMNYKLSLIEQHKTQVRQDPFSRSLENIKRLAQLRGAEIGTNFAEAYKIHRMFE